MGFSLAERRLCDFVVVEAARLRALVERPTMSARSNEREATNLAAAAPTGGTYVLVMALGQHVLHNAVT